MAKQVDQKDFTSLNEESVRLWDQIAGRWDDRLGDDGNRTYKKLVALAVERLLALRDDEMVLDVACGSGLLTRRLAQLGARVVAVDASKTFIERAKTRTEGLADRIECRVVNATDPDQLMALGEGRFDAAVCTQALMGLPTIEPLISSLGRLLKAGGRFVFSISHPCFNLGTAKRAVEEEDRDGELVTVRYVKVSQYIRPSSGKGTGIRGEPFPTYYFDRPISVLFGAFFKAGFVLDGIEEPAADESDVGASPLSWSNYKEIPSVLVARMRLMRVE